jgi:hypothetical protein
MSVINVLEAILQRDKDGGGGGDSNSGGESGKRLHVIDLCCGKSLTGCLITLLHPEFVVHTVDKISAAHLPHYPSDLPDYRGGETNLVYLQRDLFDANFVPAMETLMKKVGLVVAMYTGYI